MTMATGTKQPTRILESEVHPLQFCLPLKYPTRELSKSLPPASIEIMREASPFLQVAWGSLGMRRWVFEVTMDAEWWIEAEIG